MSPGGRRGSCSAPVSSLSVSERLAYPQSTGLSLDAVAARLGSEQCSALYRDGPSPFAEGCWVPSGVAFLLERPAAPADGYRAPACSRTSWRGERPETVPLLGENGLPCRYGTRGSATAPWS